MAAAERALRRGRAGEIKTQVGMFKKRILILVPHPDDEVVGAAAAIGRAKSAGAEAFALYLTDGCVPEDSMWPWTRKRRAENVARRRAEAEKAAEMLGIKAVIENGGDCGWPRRPSRSAIAFLHDIYREIRRAVAKEGIDQIWTPAWEGGHPDHDAINAVAGMVGATDGISVLEFSEYNFNGGRANSNRFPTQLGTEVEVRLSPEERTAKKLALAVYASEQGNLGNIGLERECFRPLPAHDYSRPPHGGTLWYARFNWVPFRHPRVNFTRPEDVCAAIKGFSQALRAVRV